MLNQSVVKKYLARQLDSWNWLKKYNHEELDTSLPDLGGLQLWLHQKASLIAILELKRLLLLMDMGGGKTLLALTLLRLNKREGNPRAIVFVPYITSVETWVEEVAKHTPELRCVALTGTIVENAAALTGPGDLFVICYASAVAMVKKNGFNSKGKAVWKLNAADVRQHFAGFNMLICDEIHKCKSAGSLTFRMCRTISAQCDWALGLTGTPFGRDLQDLWPQFYLMDFGETLGETFGLYREAFFNQTTGYAGYPEYKFNKKMLPQLKRMIQHRSLAYSVNEFADMPEKEFIRRALPCPAPAVSYIIDVKNQLRKSIKNRDLVEVENNYMKMRQLASGFMTLKGADDEKLHVRFDDNPKLDALEDLITAMPPGRKMVVFHHFVYTGQLIHERLDEMKVKHCRIWGGQKYPIQELRRFKDDASIPILVLNTKSGSSSLNLQLANYAVFFEQPDSPIDRQQAEARLWRKGQTRRVWFYDLLVKGTVDHRLNAANRSGEDLRKTLFRDGI